MEKGEKVKEMRVGELKQKAEREHSGVSGCEIMNMDGAKKGTGA